MRASTAASLALAVATAAAAAAAAAAPSPTPPPAVAAAFAADGFSVTATATYGAGVGVAAAALNATVHGNATAPKPAFYVTGTGYEMGYLTGVLASAHVDVILGVYLEHIVPSLLDPDIDAWLQNSTLAPVYDALCELLEDLLVNDSAAWFNASVAAGAIPAALVDEMRGVVDGAVAANPATPATWGRIVALNFGYDMLLALIYTGEILELLGERAAAAGWPAAARASLAALPPAAWRPPLACNALMAARSTVAGGGALMGRDFMFSTGEVFQDHVATVVYVPTDGPDGAAPPPGSPPRRPLVSVAAPGFVGSMVALNADGLMMGVDVLQAGVANTTVVGLNSLLLVRATVHAAGTTAAATAFVRGATRGVPWLYPLHDAGGDGRVLETLPSLVAGPPGGGNTSWPDLRPVVSNATLRALLPSPAQLAALLPPGLDYADGVFARNMSLHLAPEGGVIPAYNPALFGAAGVPLPPPPAWAPGGSVWANFTGEAAAYTAGLRHAFFSPERTAGLPYGADVLAVTNLALVPTVRIGTMTPWCELDGMGQPQWRYDSLLAHAGAALANGPLDLAGMQSLISWLGRAPGYYTSDVVGGILAAGDLTARVLRAKGGYWGDGWTQVTLPAYLA